jgi:hypothetical protein
LPGVRGARPGSRHALKHGRFTREALAERAKRGEMLRGARAVIAEAKVLLRELRPVAPRPPKE